MDEIERLVARREADLAVPSFETVLARRRLRRAPLTPLVIAGAVVLIVLGAGIGPLRERLAAPGPAGATAAALALPAGQVLVSPDGARIAVVGNATVTLHDPAGAQVRAWQAATAYAKWLPDGSGLLVQTRATIPGGAALLVLEAEGGTTRLSLAVPPANAAYVWLSPDGRTFAADAAAAVVTVGRDGAAPQTAIAGADHRLLGFDRSGRVLIIDGADARALGPGGYTVALPALGNPLYEAGAGASPDGTVTLVAMATPVDQLIAVSDGTARVIPRPFGWLGPHTFIARVGGGALELWDAATGAHHPIGGIPAAATLHGTSGSAVLWSAGGTTHVTDAASGSDRIVATLTPAAKAQGLAGGRFLVVDGETRLVLAPE